MKMNKEILIDYTNWRGERRWRKIRPMTIIFSASQWHPELQWLLKAVDAESGQVRQFAFKDIHEFKTEEPR